MKSIYIKELKQFFRSIVGYVYISIFLLICGYIFSTVNILSLNGDIKAFFSSGFLYILFVIPILTMRIFSEEKKLKTDQLLFVCPVSSFEIVVGKFFATMSVFMIGLVITLVYPIILILLGYSEYMTIIGNYIGITLLASVFVAIGLLVSLLTENQIVSAIVTYACIISVYSLDSVVSITQNSVIRAITSFLSVSSKFVPFTYGIFDFSSVVFFSTLCFCLLYVVIQCLDLQRQR